MFSKSSAKTFSRAAARGSIALIFILPALLAGCASSGQASSDRGYLLIAHGSAHHHHGPKSEAKNKSAAHHAHHAHHAEPDPRVEQLKRPWEQSVLRTVEEAKPRIDGPIEVAFGMWDHIAFQRAVDRLADRGISELHVIPLFVSSHSAVIYAQKYQFGLSPNPPERLPHLTKVVLPEGLQVTYGYALDESPHLTRILTERARELSENPQGEELILVAHGPVSEEENKRWIEALSVHAARIHESFGPSESFARLHVVSLRDDAGKKVRDEATRQFREIVEGAAKAGHEALVLPVLIASGGIDKGIGERLKGLKYRYTGKMIAPDPELAKWIADSTKKSN